MATSIRNFKVILCGEYGVGKSSVFRRFVDNSFTTDSGPSSTIGLDHYAKKFTAFGEALQLHLWDTAGIERFATLSSSYFQGANAALLCYSVNDRQSFSALSQCLLDVIVHTRTVRIFLCGNKSDLVQHSTSGDENVVSEADVAQFKFQCDEVLSDTYQVSCKTGHCVHEMFQSIADDLAKVVVPNFNRVTLPRSPAEFDEAKPQNPCCSK